MQTLEEQIGIEAAAVKKKKEKKKLFTRWMRGLNKALEGGYSPTGFLSKPLQTARTAWTRKSSFVNIISRNDKFNRGVYS